MNFRRAEPQLSAQRTNLVTTSQFTEAPKAVTHIAANIDAIDAVIREGVVLGVDLKRGVAGVGTRRKKPAALRAKRPEQFRLDAVSISEQHIGTPFRAEPWHVHKREAPPGGDTSVAPLRIIYFNGRREHWS